LGLARRAPGAPAWSRHPPIAGLIHHGSGPHYTSLLDPNFPDLLARHAERVARRYPWIDAFTPVNEPLTTARFSALYGHWYPHQASYPAFLTALIHQCQATVKAMRAIRQVTPHAQLIQTDDFGKTFSTAHLIYQANFENERRWLTFDLLCGRVTPGTFLWDELCGQGIAEADLAFFLDDPGNAPDIIGINHYLTSERFLDEQVGRYPEHLRGGNGYEPYADVEAVRVNLPEDDIGPAARLREVWERYQRPMAVTEVHHGCTRDEQLRWLSQVWQAAEGLRSEGADIRAVTIWSLLGTVDWNTLLTRQHGIYEPGAFDVRGPAPRPTALATAAKSLATDGSFDHPVLDRPGWWRRESRFYRPVKSNCAIRTVGAPRSLLVTGATGTLGRAFSRICGVRGLDHCLSSRREIDIADAGSVERALRRIRPWAVVNTAGFVRVAEAEREQDQCFRENSTGPAVLAEACARHGIPLVTFSSDLVFDGRLGRPYLESDPTGAGCTYGSSKAEAEHTVLAAHPNALIARTSAFFGPWDRHNFVWWVLDRLASGQTVEAGPDIVSPTYVPDLVHVVLDLLVDGERGIWHLTNPGSVSWFDLARRVAERAGFPREAVRLAADRPPLDTTLATERGALLPPLDSGLDRFFADCETDWAAASRRRMAAE